MKKFSFIILAMAFAMTMVSCEKEDEKTGNATGGSVVVDQVSLAGTTWTVRMEHDYPQIGYHGVIDYFMCFETDSNLTQKLYVIEMNGVQSNDSLIFHTTYVFDGEDGNFINTEGGHSLFHYDSQSHTLIAIDSDDPSYSQVLHQVE